jgi:[ribosomal protein S5]-alanine N-acetyltransferase
MAEAQWLTTERLALRPFTSHDLDWLAELYADVEVCRYLGVKSRAQTEEHLNTRILRYYDDHAGLGIWMTIERQTGAQVGFHLLNHIQGESIIQIGFGLIKSAWGKGYGTEMAFALMHYGFVDRGLTRIAGIANLQNHASQHVLTKIGLVRHGERAFPHPAYAAQGAMAWFERDAAPWLAHYERRPK